MKKSLKIKKLYRTMQIETSAIEQTRNGGDDRTIELSFSSEEPYERYFGIEILDHNSKSVRLARLNKGGALLADHDRTKPIGVIEKAYIGADKKGRATVRFSKSPEAEIVFQDVLDGIRQNVSVGYRIHDDGVLQENTDPDNPVFRMIDWEPLEVSIVSVPMDIEVGIGRNDDSEFKPKITIGDQKMEKNTNDNSIRDRERTRFREIHALGALHGCENEAMKAINEGATLDQFREIILEKKGAIEKTKPIIDPSIGFGNHEVQRYSLIKAIRSLADPKYAMNEGGFEMEASRAVAKRIGRDPKGLFVPLDIQNSFQRDVTYDGTGSNLVGTQHLSGSFIDVLRNSLVVMDAGARILNGLQGNISIPKKTGSATAYWLTGDGDTITESTPVFSAVTGIPHCCAGLCEFTHRMLIQSSPDIENIFRSDLIDTIATAIDAAALAGSGSANQPEGVLNNSSIGSTTFLYAGSPDWDDILALESTVAAENAEAGKCSYITTPALRAGLKNKEKATNTAQFVWEDGKEPGQGKMNGYKALATNQMSTDNILFGDFSQLMIAQWGVLEILANPYTNFAEGNVQVRAIFDVDILIRQPGAFAKIYRDAPITTEAP